MKKDLNELFCFRAKTEIHAGVGVCDRLEHYLRRFAQSKIILLVDKRLEEMALVKSVIGQLKSLGECFLLEGPLSEPDFEYLENIRNVSQKWEGQVVVGLGGGATIDAAKGLAMVLTNEGPCSDYQGLDLCKNPGLPCVVIPTLLGTGAEITPSAVFINRAKNKKGGINGREVFPQLALIDPRFLLDAPTSLVVTTVFDGLVHAIESSVAKCRTPISKMYSIEATKVLLRGLDLLRKEATSMEAFSCFALGAIQAVTALMHSEQGLAGAASYPLGVYYSVPHAVAGGRLLPHAIIYNGKKVPGLWGELEQELDCAAEGTGNKISEQLLKHADYFQVPSLSKWLVHPDIKLLAGETWNFKGIMSHNPAELSVAEIEEFLERAVQ